MAIKVLIIDDSALMRSMLTEVINSAPDLEVVGVAPDPIVAREMIKTHNPDVLTLDIEMPKMDGLDFLARLMRLRPMPVVMISSLTKRGSEATLQTLELGAMIECAETVAHSALLRTESRGAHQRLDFVERDDKAFLKHSMAHYNPNGDPRIDYLDVVITKSQPAARVYGAAAGGQVA